MKEQFETKNLLLKLNKKAQALPEILFEYDHFETLEIISENLESIDARIKRLKNLKTISINAKALTFVAKELFLIETLKTIKIKNTKLQELSDDLEVKCLELENLQLNNNQLSKLPTWLGKLEKLTLLDAAKNHLSSLPESFAKLKKLKRLNLDSNHFETAPSSLLVLHNLQHISIDQNPLTEKSKNELFKIFKIWF
ncbi:MAG: hypothetical protein A2381_06410 [Bdellovibrionales bacterium RIFOXYB1_FULL_37_110]|nr:MAG: hypothetical protein A2181_08430 [Bdellovibrionales bacterium RIFOXYA1_FULL_38_20]OFZ50174.1 MAG: hypothetical protein A2417_19260 [Bdellovibrionales bacterium RIFOXYC1_FULL_37_79]OFZ57611.1 MAG: hypothetical protein A2381_06410 [Bdellovibrionales bacterium RIFOXYB1_FULL_37_110]OFZ61321.1 MAG: hypothetical protein A2328_05880 [Bdellovibrionales bacterium RIFOXYB2_FULL_36_6]OFZ61378.1 MAG: hypothetical protein A2577_00775 [Bdellovibrionales bacterium RIFOXYD1_FULL_36_51]